jgi:hypothetical protein
MKKITCILFILISFCFTKAQTIGWQFAKGITGSSTDYVRSTVTDPSGNILVAGNSDSPVLSIGTTTFANIGYDDVYMAKYDAPGNLLWAKQ